MTTTSRGPSRRTLVKGAAWSVPVVAVAGAAPAWAASQEVTFRNLCSACKLPGASCESSVGVTKGYTLAMEFCTTVRGTVTVVFADAAGTLCGEDRIFDVSTLTVEGSEDGTAVCKTVYLGLQTEPNSANCEISGTTTFTWTSSNGLTGSGSLDFYAATTPPCSYGPNPGCLPDPAEANCTDPVVTTTDEKLDVKVDEAPASADVATTDSAPAPAPAAPVEPAPAPAPADDASATSTP